MNPETEKTLREFDASEIGVLIATVILPEGPAHGQLEEGDVLVKINGRFITKFVPLEDLLDNSIGDDITVEVERGGLALEFSISVQDLHSM